MKQNCLIAVMTFVLSGCSSERSAIVSKQSVSVFAKEADAAYEGSLNREPVNPLTTIQNGDRVSVLKDTYGRDYWACKVKLQNDISGWVLCTDLSFQQGG